MFLLYRPVANKFWEESVFKTEELVVGLDDDGQGVCGNNGDGGVWHVITWWCEVVTRRKLRVCERVDFETFSILK